MTGTDAGAGLPAAATPAHAARMEEVTAALGGGVAYGGDYNPEQWPESTWAKDVALMRQAGVNLVTVGVFSWALIERTEGHYDFGWLDRVLDLLHEGGVRVDLANASATPPPWFSRAYPQSLPVDEYGVRRSPGGRQAFCPSSPDYRAASARLTTAIADRYAGHPAVVLWHVHNEYGCHNDHCYCDTSAAAFRSWLQRRYGQVEALNTAWGTAFWSQHYEDWAEVLPPRVPAYRTFANPTQQLDFWRFSSEELLDCYRAEAAILRARSTRPVTTNFMGFFKPLDYWAWALEQDVVSNDHYLIGEGLGEGGATHDLAMSADLMRSLAGGQPWLLMEHSTSAVNWQPRNAAKAPGQLARNSLTHLARGADGALFFQWRASRAGAEKYHSALVPHAGTDSRVWREVVDLGQRLAGLAEVTGSTVQAAAAVVFDWPSWWGLELDSHPSADVTMLAEVRRWHRALWERGITCDFVAPGGDLGRYRLLLVPHLYLVTDDGAEAVAAAARQGATVVVGWLSGVVDENDHIRLGGYPGAFRDLLGVRIEEFAPLLAGEQATVTGLPTPVSATLWTERGRVTDATVVASYADGPSAGDPAVTRRPVGAGVAWYLGTRLDDTGLDQVLADAVADAGVTPALDLGGAPWPGGLEAVRRATVATSYLFLVNHGAGPVTVPADGVDLLTGEAGQGETTVPAGGVRVLRQPGG
ncbi:MAG TPA: beta-galactosidase [Dermatophilaceae bacterium]|nr:beta-galactosidase [Dermatophilaceae bacterium]